MGCDTQRAATAPTVFVVDDDPVVRSTVQALCGSVGLPVETHPSAQDFLATNDTERAGCLVLDVRLPGMSGVELLEELATRADALPTIMITGHPDIAVAVRCLRAGALDFIVKPFSEQILLERIAEAMARDRQIRASARRRALLASRVTRLSPREREVLTLVVAGKANKVMAIDLGIAEKTVEVHRARVMAKMGADSLAELVRDMVFLRSEPETGARAAGPVSFRDPQAVRFPKNYRG